MQAKKATSSQPLSTLVSRSLKIVGVVITLSALLDVILLAIPFQLLSREWQINFVTQLVDRGIVPLVGIVLFLAAFWIDGNAGTSAEQRTLWKDPRFWALVLSSILGALFLVLFPLHLNNVRLAYQDSAQQITQEVTNTEQQISSQVESEIESQRQQIALLLSATDEQLDQLVQEGRLSPDQRELVEGFRANPDSVNSFLTQRRQELTTQAQAQLGDSQAQAQQQLQTNALKSGLRVGISSLLLSLGFILVGWTGLKMLRQM